MAKGVRNFSGDGAAVNIGGTLCIDLGATAFGSAAKDLAAVDIQGALVAKDVAAILISSTICNNTAMDGDRGSIIIDRNIATTYIDTAGMSCTFCRTTCDRAGSIGIARASCFGIQNIQTSVGGSQIEILPTDGALVVLATDDVATVQVQHQLLVFCNINNILQFDFLGQVVVTIDLSAAPFFPLGNFALTSCAGARHLGGFCGGFGPRLTLSKDRGGQHGDDHEDHQG